MCLSTNTTVYMKHYIYLGSNIYRGDIADYTSIILKFHWRRSVLIR